MLEVKNLVKSFPGVTAVNNLSFQISQGSICGFVGPNGAGKTTTMRIISTLEMPDKGNIWIHDTSVYEDPYGVRKIIGFMPDHLGVYPDMTVEEYLQFYARVYCIDPALRDKRIAEIMDFTELNKLSEKLVDALSKGMRQRLNLGRALINDPKLMIMDEPAGGLDPRARVELRYMIKQLAEMGKTVFISSHILSELSEICDHMLIIEKGQMVTHGNIQEIRQRLKTSNEIQITLNDKEQVPELEKTLLELEEIRNIFILENNDIRFEIAGEEKEIPRIISFLLEKGYSIIQFKSTEKTMEDLFIELTQGEVQ